MNEKDKNVFIPVDIPGFLASCIYCAVPLGLTDTASWGEEDSFASLNEQIRSIQPINQSDFEKAMKGELSNRR